MYARAQNLVLISGHVTVGLVLISGHVTVGLLVTATGSGS